MRKCVLVDDLVDIVVIVVVVVVVVVVSSAVRATIEHARHNRDRSYGVHLSCLVCLVPVMTSSPPFA